MQPEAVILDIGNVLIEWHPERFYDRVIGAQRRRALFASVDLDGMNAAIDLGAPFRDTVLDMARRHPEFAAEIRLWHDRWIEMASPAIPHSVTLFRRLRARGVPVFALSNFGVDSFALAERHYPFFGEFDRRYISCHLGVMKPDPRIYELVEAESGLPPGRLLFADDRRDNIEAAAARGWQVHHFDGPEGWARALVAYGLLTQEEAAP
jgi:2-haloacid dehalogenase